MFGFGKLATYDYFAHVARALKERFAAAGQELRAPSRASDDRSANPSIALLANGGTASADTTGSASTWPRASRIGRRTVSSGATSD